MGVDATHFRAYGYSVVGLCPYMALACVVKVL